LDGQRYPRSIEVRGSGLQGGGLFLIVKTSGAKWWRFSYRFEDKQKTVFFGVFPDVGLKYAFCERRDEAKNCCKRHRFRHGQESAEGC
jgi:hypothetical protein